MSVFVPHASVILGLQNIFLICANLGFQEGMGQNLLFIILC